jgi:glycerol-3-phosphate dehydrogenase
VQPHQRLNIDVAIIGGGAAGLWTLDLLTRAGLRVLLLESAALGSGQTIAAQGIIHGGLKYTLDGAVGDSAKAIAGMPLLWRDWCALWRTSDLRSQFGMVGARAVLQVSPVELERADWPAVLARCPGDVYRLDEPVIDPASLLADLASRHRARILKYDFENGATFEHTADRVETIRLADQHGGSDLELRPRTVVLAAGEGNAALRARAGLTASAMQLRPLHMVLARGPLPTLNGHCTDGAKTRVTVTTAVDRRGRTVWQVGGQIAEDGVAMTTDTLLAHARRELAAAIPGFSTAGVEWSTHRVNRAEAAIGGGKRPSDVFCEREGNVITAWPTKLALVPRLAQQVAGLVSCPTGGDAWEPEGLDEWPRPDVALPSWEEETAWTGDH